MSRELVITVPSWVDAIVARHAEVTTDETKMALAIALAAENVARGGGPFGAAVFDGDTCIGAGVNRVLDTGYSIAHAEVVAISAAQKTLLHTNTARTADRVLTLVTSAEPCCQCFGAVVWSGIGRLVCGATTEDVEAIGFDEGPKPTDWQETLRNRGIEVVEQVQRSEASAVLHAYQQAGGVIY